MLPTSIPVGPILDSAARLTAAASRSTTFSGIVGTTALHQNSGESLRILLTNVTLTGRTGTEIVVRNLAAALLRAGHRPMVYSPRLGPIADELRRLSIPVTDDIGSITQTPDVIHGHHVIQTAAAAMRFPQVPAIFVCHDFVIWHDRPPVLPNVRRFAAISAAFSERLTIESGIDPSLVEVIENAADMARFLPGPPLPERPRRALALVKDRTSLEHIAAACAQRDIVLEVAGPGVDRVLEAPETEMLKHDLVFCSAMTAIEAMATLRAVIVVDGRGLAGLVTPQRYRDWRRENFGLRTYRRASSVQALLEEIDLYDPSAAHQVGQTVRAEAGVEPWAARYVDLYRRAMADPTPDPSPQATAHAAALHIQAWNPDLDLLGWTHERAGLQAEIDRLEYGLDTVTPGETVPAKDFSRVSLTGFHAAEDWGAWSKRPAASVRFRLPEGRTCRQVTIEALPFLPPSRPRCAIACALDGVSIGSVDLLAEGLLRFTLTFDPLEEGGQHWLTFTIDRCLSPAEAGLSTDGRPLGFGLVSIRLD